MPAEETFGWASDADAEEAPWHPERCPVIQIRELLRRWVRVRVNARISQGVGVDRRTAPRYNGVTPCDWQATTRRGTTAITLDRAIPVA